MASLGFGRIEGFLQCAGGLFLIEGTVEDLHAKGALRAPPIHSEGQLHEDAAAAGLGVARAFIVLAARHGSLQGSAM